MSEIIALISLTGAFPTPNATEQVEGVIKTLTMKSMTENLQKFSSFRNRC